MPEQVAFYPWLPDWVTVVEIFIASAATVMAFYIWMRSGREPYNRADSGGHPPVRNYAGLVSIDSNKTPIFLMLLYIFLVLWAIAYLIQITVHGYKY